MATSKFLNQSSNPYSAGAIVLDTTPITQYYLNQEAKKQAKDEALEKYYQDEMSKLSSEGMRSEDLPVFSQKFNKLKEMWVQNKEAIKNPSKYGFDKAQEYNQLRNDLLNIPIESKAEKEKDIFVTKLLGDPTKRELIDIPTLNEAMRLQKMPIRSEGRKSIDTANLPFVAKEMTPQEKQNYIKSTLSLIGTEGRFGEQKAIDKYKKGTEYIEEYSNKSLKLAGDKARTDALNNPTLRRTAKLDFERVSPEMKMELNKFHEEVYGRPIQSSEDILAAEIIQAGKMAKKVSVKTMENYDARAALELSNSLAKIAANQGGVFNPQNAIDLIYQSGRETNNAYKFKEGQPRIYGREVTLTPELEDDFYDKRRGVVQRPDYTVMSHDKNKLYLIYTDENGKTDTDKSREINVPTDLVSSLGKNYGGAAWTRKNLFTRTPFFEKNNQKNTEKLKTIQGKVR